MTKIKLFFSFLGRIDYQDLKLRVNESRAEFVWRGSPSLGQDSQVFAGLTGESLLAGFTNTQHTKVTAFYKNIKNTYIYKYFVFVTTWAILL